MPGGGRAADRRRGSEAAFHHVAPSFYERFPAGLQVTFGSSITSAVIVVFMLNLMFNH